MRRRLQHEHRAQVQWRSIVIGIQYHLLFHTHNNQRNPATSNKPTANPIPSRQSRRQDQLSYLRSSTRSISLFIIIRHLLIKILRRLGGTTSRSSCPPTSTPPSPPTTGSTSRLRLRCRSNGPIHTSVFPFKPRESG